MATPYRIQVAANDTGLLSFDQSDDTAAVVSDLLQKDLNSHHVFFNKSGFHNHIVHHILALYGTGAGPSSLKQGYADNLSYQRPTQPTHSQLSTDLASWDVARKHLGKEKYYPDFLAFYQREAERLGGWQPLLETHLFAAGDPRAEDLLQRMFAGFLHPLIQLMYGVEWGQPAVVAQALAQACVHDNKLGAFLMDAEKASVNVTGKSPPILDLIAAAAADPKISRASRLSDGNLIYDGVLGRAAAETTALCARVHVDAEDLEERTAEMFHAAVYVAAGAAIHPPKEPKFDFYLMHHVNSAPFFVALNRQPWLTTANKIRILEWKIRMDIVQYAARGCPELPLDKILSYEQKDSVLAKDSRELLSRLHDIDDDGHAIKLARSVEVCKQICAKFADKPWAKIKGDDAWSRLMHMVVDSLEGDPAVKWVRSAGFDESWKEIPDRK